jgi:hypothetical protein
MTPTSIQKGFAALLLLAAMLSKQTIKILNIATRSLIPTDLSNRMTKKGLTRINEVISSLYSILFFLFLILSNIAAGTEDTTLQPLEFNRDIRPILAEKCFYCHGPDPNKREADLRLDQRQSALDAGAIDPSGKPDP